MKKELENFIDLRFGIFIHWGLYSVPGGEYKGKTMDYIGEWTQSFFRIPNAEYEKFATIFNPHHFDADKWVQRWVQCGAKYIVFTTKHHEGFCMFHTAYDSYNIFDATPFHRDILAELSAACHKYNIKFGVYYSHSLDWHEKNASHVNPQFSNNKGMSWGNDWDFPDDKEKNFDTYFNSKVLPQIREIMSNYGEVSYIWFDTAFNITPKHCEQLISLIHSLQPNCLINNRIGCGFGDIGSLGDNQALYSPVNFAAESPITLNDTWGYKPSDHNWKSSDLVIHKLLECTQTHSNLLLNIGPQPDGEWTPDTIRILSEVGDWIAQYGEMLYESAGSPFPQPLDFAFSTLKGNSLFFYLTKPLQNVSLHGIITPVSNANVTFRQSGDRVDLSFDSSTQMIRLDFNSKPEISQTLQPQNGNLILPPNAASLCHGKEDVAIIKGDIDVDGLKHEEAPHSCISSTGGLTQWHNPSDSAIWNFSIPTDATFSFSLQTAQRSHGKPWTGGRTIRVRVDQDSFEQIISADIPGPASCYATAKTNLGKFHLSQGLHQIEITTVSLADESEAAMELTGIFLNPE